LKTGTGIPGEKLRFSFPEESSKSSFRNFLFRKNFPENFVPRVPPRGARRRGATAVILAHGCGRCQEVLVGRLHRRDVLPRGCPSVTRPSKSETPSQAGGLFGTHAPSRCRDFTACEADWRPRLKIASPRAIARLPTRGRQCASPDRNAPLLARSVASRPALATVDPVVLPDTRPCGSPTLLQCLSWAETSATSRGHVASSWCPCPENERIRATALALALYSSLNPRRSPRGKTDLRRGLVPTSWWSVLPGQAQSSMKTPSRRRRTPPTRPRTRSPNCGCSHHCANPPGWTVTWSVRWSRWGPSC
jgi:hypothetical protein